MRESHFTADWYEEEEAIEEKASSGGGLGGVVILLPAVHEWGDDVHRDREHNGAVLLSRDVVQGLQVPQLKQSKKTGLTG